jgi:outer membrane receptor protein involved in Fe transport
MRRLLLALLLVPVCALAQSVTLPTVEVTADRDYSYFSGDYVQTAGTRLPSKQLDSSRSITTIPDKAIVDQGDTNTNQVMMRNVPGISVNSNLAGNRSNFMLRGFNIHDNDGSKIDGQYNLTWADVDLFNIEQVQVVRGPNASFGGKGDPGGFVNYVTKKADWTNSFEVIQAVTGTGGYIGSFQKNFAINDALASRTVFTYSDDKNPALSGDSKKNRQYFSQNFMAKLSDKTSLEVDFRHSSDKQNYGYTSQLPAVGNAPASFVINLAKKALRLVLCLCFLEVEVNWLSIRTFMVGSVQNRYTEKSSY